MIFDWTDFDPQVFRSRRGRLGRTLGAWPALFASGKARPRNYPDNTYPFRAESHFLYLFGVPIPGAIGLVEGEQALLYAPPPEPDASLWYGTIPSLAEIGERAGVEVRPFGELPMELAGRRVASLPVQDAATTSELQNLLGRRIDPEGLEEPDATLADSMIALRLRQDDAALASIRRAVAATAAAHAAGRAGTRPGRTEAEVRAAMEAELIARNMTVAYPSIVTVHGEVLHNNAYHHRIGAQDLLLADVGAESKDGWASDVTRTWPASGALSPTQKALYEVVLSAQREAIAMVRPSVRYRDVHLGACRKLAQGLTELGLLRGDADELVADGVHALLFPHGIGHLLGMDVHDMEDLGDRAGYAPGRARSKQFGLSYLRLDRDLEAGMLVTIEPGIYLAPALLKSEHARRAGDRLVRSEIERYSDVRGIRIEDDVLCTAEGHEVLTSAIPK